MSAALTVVATLCLHDAKGCMHFCWVLIPENIHVVWTNSGNRLRFWNSLFWKWQTLCAPMVEKCETCYLESHDHSKGQPRSPAVTVSSANGTPRSVRSLTANSEDLLKAVSWFLAFVPPNPVALSLSFCTNSSTFLMSVVTKLFTVFEVAWLLSFVHLCRHCHLCSWEIRGTGQEGFSKGFSYCRATACWCQRHHLTQFPSCLFQHLSSWHHKPVLYIVQDQRGVSAACFDACSSCYYCPKK